MKITDDLDEVQLELNRQQLCDVKFFWNECFKRGLERREDLQKEVALCLSSFLAGEHKPLEKFGDLLLEHKEKQYENEKSGN